MMNLARKLEVNDRKAAARKAEVIYLAGRKAGEDKKVSINYLNERLNYFYANGGPVMEI